LILGFTLCHQKLMAVLRETREAAGISQRRLSEKMRQPHNYINKVETGQRMPNWCEVMQIIEVIGADPVRFMQRYVELSGRRPKR
jgi:transcriptional regulator with XRE-family HTH domain